MFKSCTLKPNCNWCKSMNSQCPNSETQILIICELPCLRIVFTIPPEECVDFAVLLESPSWFLLKSAVLPCLQALAPIPEEENESPPDSPTNQTIQSKLPTTLPAIVKEPEAPPPKVGWDAIAKPKEHSTIDYSRWGNLGDDLSDDEDEDEDEPQYAYRLKRVGLSNFKSLGTW